MDSRRLVVVRHAKSAWPDDVPDEQRPLNPRGRRDAPVAGRWIRERVERVDADAGSMLLVGHNPGVSDLVFSLTGEHVELKTSAIAVLDVTGSWADAAPGRVRLVEHATPRGS